MSRPGPEELPEELLQELTFEVEPDEDGLFVSRCPELGIASCGSTREEAMANIKEAAMVHMAAFEEEPTQHRTRPYRTLVRFNGFDPDREILDAVIHAWNPDQAVKFHADLLRHSLRRSLTVDQHGSARVFARVNINAERAQDLTFDNFEEAPPPGTKDLLT